MIDQFKLIFPIEAGGFAHAGEASSKIKRALKQIGLPSEVVRRTVIVAYEAEMNLVIHSYGGELLLQVSPEGIFIQTKDQGPGIADLERAMEEGYSTASEEVRQLGFGAGMGLPNIKRNADNLTLQSEIGKGTLLQAWVDLSNV